MKKLLLHCLALSVALLSPLLPAETVYQSKEAFIESSLGSLPKASVLWLDDTQKANIESILAHRFAKLRLRYWRDGAQTVWIMDEIGKESPITVGIHVGSGQIIKTQVLVYRESRGDEVRHDFFTDQFKSATLTPKLELDRNIDGITGATLSVKALTKLSRIALYLDAAVQKTP